MPFKTGLAEERNKILQNALEGIIPKIIEIDVEKIVLFGSLATNSTSKSSDIDIIVIKKNR